jgi:hypothetical protein
MKYKDEEYASISELARAKGINKGTLTHRIAAGWDIEKAAITPVKSVSAETEYNGQKYKSRSALARAYGLTPAMLNKRLEKGMSLGEAVETPRMRELQEIEYSGHKYKSVGAMAKSLGLAYSALRFYISKLDDPADIGLAVEKCREKMNAPPPSLWGNQYESHAQIARRFGFEPDLILHRQKKGSPLEDAVIDILHKEPILFESERYANITELCRAYNAQPVTVVGRILIGFSLEEAVHAPVNKKPGISVSYGGVDYESQIELCRAYGISNAAVSSLTCRGKFEFTDVFELFLKLKEQAGMKRGELITSVPGLVINGRVYYDYRTAARDLGLDANILIVQKSIMKSADMVETLKVFQRKTRDGKPAYPILAALDLSDRCADIRTIYKEMLSELESKRPVPADENRRGPDSYIQEETEPEEEMALKL